MTAAVRPDDPILHDFADLIGAEDRVAVVGGRTRWDVGGAPTQPVRLVEAPTGIVDHRPEEMTVRVRAGTTVAELDATLAAAGQRCALPDRGGTVGGALAVGENHPEALARGLIRNCVLQVRYVSAEGRLISGGGPTVKNVTGFDLPRIMVGSLGTLGLLAEVILRTNPIPGASRWLRAEGVAPAAVLDAVLAPSAVLWDGADVWVHLEGHPIDVDAAEGALAGIGRFGPTQGAPALPRHRWSVAPAEAREWSADRAGPFVAALGLGLVWAEEPPPPATVDPGVSTVSRRLKDVFDPTGRLNPGRDPLRR